ncbi:histidine kinase dimerization/phosphoacceptor domain-containing protein [Nonomuraea candida]|uniref:histidine kinase dimerization/phosphoacceptor domain-containing protein n=1 Tax=Nonomuraea candida TaxID=359159 RepID=UPI0005B817F3
MARGLHDVVTHHVTAMVVQAEAARYLTAAPDRLDAALTAVTDTGRRAIGDLRHLLDLLDLLRADHDLRTGPPPAQEAGGPGERLAAGCALRAGQGEGGGPGERLAVECALRAGQGEFEQLDELAELFRDILAELPELAAALAAGEIDVRARAVPLAEVAQAWTAGSDHRIVLVP